MEIIINVFKCYFYEAVLSDKKSFKKAPGTSNTLEKPEYFIDS